MELRKDPVTQSWVIQEEEPTSWPDFNGCPLCPGHESCCPQTIYAYPADHSNWQVRVVPHLRPLYRIEGDAQRRGEGIYDKMRSLGAHEILVEHPDHQRPLFQQSDEHMAQILRACVSRVGDLKRDRRFKYVAVFRNQGAPAGQELDHPHSQIAATPFIPRRVVYELRSSQRYFELKERCLLCDIAKQEVESLSRIVEGNDRFVAFCPFASRVPYETWIMPLQHHASFEEELNSWDHQLAFGRFLKSILRRLDPIAPSYHMVLHTTPNTNAKFEKTGNWRTLAEDFHWHVEILPARLAQPKSYSVREVYYNSLRPEIAAAELREAGART